MQQYSSPLIFVRHGATDWNRQSRYQGTTDTRLSPVGVDQAASQSRTICELAKTEDFDLDKALIVTSPLRRAQETAEIIRTSLKLHSKPRIEPAFRELSMGRWEGLTSQEVKDQYYLERKSRKANRWEFRPEGGESMADRKGEIDAALMNLPPNTILITHSVVLRVICFLLGADSKENCAVRQTPHDETLCWNGAKLHRQRLN